MIVKNICGLDAHNDKFASGFFCNLKKDFLTGLE